MSETVLLRQPRGIASAGSPAVAAALLSLPATAEFLQSLSKNFPTGGLGLIIAEVLAVIGALIASVTASRVSKRIE